VALPRLEGTDARAFVAPDLRCKAALIVAPQSLEASLLARRLTRWGAAAKLANAATPVAAIASQSFDVALVDHALGANAVAVVIRSIGATITRRIVLITPSERYRLPMLKAAGFTGYLVKPVRAASLAARLTGYDTFETSGAVETSIAPAATQAAGKSLAILVAEDNEINALLARSLLAKLGHRPVAVANGAEAVAAWHAAQADGAPFDIVLMDVQMPGVDGLEATRQIRAAEAAADGRRTPIVALTANAFAEDRESCMAAGMDDFLVKPLDRDRLAAMLTELPSRAAMAA